MAKTKKAQPATAEMETLNGMLPIPIQEVPAQTPPAVISPEDWAKSQISKYDLSLQVIANKKKEFAKLKIKGAEDKEGYKLTESAWQWLKNKRIATEKTRKELKAGPLLAGKIIDSKGAEITEALQVGPGGELEMAAALEKIDNIKKEEKEKEEREAQEKLNQRVNDLLANGMSFTGSYYTIGESTSIDVVTLKAMRDEDFTKLFESVKQQNAAAIAAKADAERKAQEEKERLETQRKEQEAAQLKLDQERAQMEQEKRNFLEQRTNLRAATLEGLGMQYKYNTRSWVFEAPDHGRVSFPKDRAETLNVAEFDDWMEKNKPEIQTLKDKQAETIKQREELQRSEDEKRQNEEKEKAFKEERARVRIDDLKASFSLKETETTYSHIFPLTSMIISVFKSDILDFDSVRWIELKKTTRQQFVDFASAETEMERAEAKKKEEARKTALTDIERVREYLTQFSAESEANPAPHIDNARIAHAFNLFTEACAEAAENLEAFLDSFE